MLIPALIAVVVLFALLFVGRVGGAYRRLLIERWPAALFAGAAIIALARGGIWPGMIFAVAAALAWILAPYWRRTAAAQPGLDPAESEARAILGVGPSATEAEIRGAYRAKMARAHPDRGGGHNEAARLTAARDRLLKRPR